MIGRRLADGDFPEQPGDYSKFEQARGEAWWMVIAPNGGPACLIGKPNADGSPYHWVEEHEDGTITVQPMPPDAPEERRNSNSILWNGWHGYIRRGIWEGC